MTYSLPFGLKQKPVRKYLKGGSISFSCRDEKLYGKITSTNKTRKFTFPEFEIKSKEQLDNMLKSKSVSMPETLGEQPTIEEVVS